MKKAIVLCSGGLDSVVCAHYVKKKDFKEIILLFFDYGQKALKAERKCAKACAKDLGANFLEINIRNLGKISGSLINKKGKINTIGKKDLRNTKKESEKWYVPFRNGLFLSYALAVCESEKQDCDIFIGFQSEGSEAYPDTTSGFVRAFNNVSKIACSSNVKIKSPLINKDKNEIVSLGKKLGVDFKKTFSCYVGEKLHCGECLNCALRKQGFYWANIKDPTKYSKK